MNKVKCFYVDELTGNKIRVKAAGIGMVVVVAPAEGHSHNGKDVIDRWCLTFPDTFLEGFDNALQSMENVRPFTNKWFNTQKSAVSFAKRLIALAAA